LPIVDDFLRDLAFFDTTTLLDALRFLLEDCLLTGDLLEAVVDLDDFLVAVVVAVDLLLVDDLVTLVDIKNQQKKKKTIVV
jgi:hypothetical protein